MYGERTIFGFIGRFVGWLFGGWILGLVFVLFGSMLLGLLVSILLAIIALASLILSFGHYVPGFVLQLGSWIYAYQAPDGTKGGQFFISSIYAADAISILLALFFSGVYLRGGNGAIEKLLVPPESSPKWPSDLDEVTLNDRLKTDT